MRIVGTTKICHYSLSCSQLCAQMYILGRLKYRRLKIVFTFICNLHAPHLWKVLASTRSGADEMRVHENVDAASPDTEK